MPKYEAIESNLSVEARAEFQRSAAVVLAFLSQTFGEREFSAQEAKERFDTQPEAMTAMVSCCTSCYGPRYPSAVPSALLLLRDWEQGEPTLRLSAVRENQFIWRVARRQDRRDD